MTILVATTTDNISAMRVAELLRAKGHNPLTLLVDAVANGSQHLLLSMDNKSATLSYDNQRINLNSFRSAWEWHGTYYESSSFAKMAVTREIQQTFYGLYNAIIARRWLNQPYRVRDTQEKVSQMVIARRSGFLIPPTVITTKWDDVSQLSERTAMKMPFMGWIEGDAPKVLYTTMLSRNTRKILVSHSPFPGVHQPHLSKKREWRITVVGDKVFPVAIYTDDEAKDDWRRHQNSKDRVMFRHEPLTDSSIDDKCKKMLKKMGLRYGAFDFIETPKGEMIFLEVNSAGQYGWLEDELGLPISEAIVELLIKIASK